MEPNTKIHFVHQQSYHHVQMSGPPARKTSTVKIVPIQPAENGAVKDPHTFQVPKLKETPKTETKLQSREIKVPVTVTHKPKEAPIQVHIDTAKKEAKEPPKPEPVAQDLKKTLQDVKRQKQEVKEPPMVKEVKKPAERDVPVLRETKKIEPKKDGKVIPITKKEENVPIQLRQEPDIDKVSLFIIS